jgi:uncharacterized protein (DUF1778 family)
MSRPSLPNRTLLGAAGLLIALMPPAAAFECPEPQAGTGAGVIQDSQDEIDRLSDLLRTGDLDNRLEILARDLKKKHANADRTELTNFMVSAYCPVIAEEDLSDSEKDARLSAFEQQVWDFYAEEGP